MKKYEFTGKTKNSAGVILHQIRALIDFGNVKLGDLGGWIESEKNLSQEGNAWVYDNARVHGDARVYGNAQVRGDAWVYGTAWVHGNAWVYGNARVYGYAWVYGNAEVCGDAQVYGNATVYDNARVGENAEVDGNAWVGENAQIDRISDIFEIRHIGSRNGTTTFFRTRSKQIHVKCGCFSGTIDEFETKVKATHGDNMHAKMYRLAIQMAKLKLGGD